MHDTNGVGVLSSETISDEEFDGYLGQVAEWIGGGQRPGRVVGQFTDLQLAQLQELASPAPTVEQQGWASAEAVEEPARLDTVEAERSVRLRAALKLMAEEGVQCADLKELASAIDCRVEGLSLDRPANDARAAAAIQLAREETAAHYLAHARTPEDREVAVARWLLHPTRPTDLAPSRPLSDAAAPRPRPRSPHGRRVATDASRGTGGLDPPRPSDDDPARADANHAFAANGESSLVDEKLSRELAANLGDPDQRATTLNALGGSEDYVVGYVCPFLELPGIDTPFPTPMPPRKIEGSSEPLDYQKLGRLAVIARGSNGQFVLRHLDESGGWFRGESWLLTEVYTALVSRRTTAPSSAKKKPNPQLPRWSIRLLVGTGRLWLDHLPQVSAGERPAAIHDQIWATLTMFFQIRALTDAPGESFTLSRLFVADWCRVGYPGDSKSVLEALRREVLVSVNAGGSDRFENPTNYYRLRADIPAENIVRLSNGFLVTSEFRATRADWLAAHTARKRDGSA